MMTALTKVKCVLWDRLGFLCTHESGLRSEGGTEGSPEDGAGVRNNFLWVLTIELEHLSAHHSSFALEAHTYTQSMDCMYMCTLKLPWRHLFQVTPTITPMHLTNLAEHCYVISALYSLEILVWLPISLMLSFQFYFASQHVWTSLERPSEPFVGVLQFLEIQCLRDSWDPGSACKCIGKEVWSSTSWLRKSIHKVTPPVTGCFSLISFSGLKAIFFGLCAVSWRKLP